MKDTFILGTLPRGFRGIKREALRGSARQDAPN